MFPSRYVTHSTYVLSTCVPHSSYVTDYLLYVIHSTYVLPGLTMKVMKDTWLPIQMFFLTNEKVPSYTASILPGNIGIILEGT